MAQIRLNQVIGLLEALDNKASKFTTISAGSGLTGGGDLSSSRTFSLTGSALSLANLSTTGLVVRLASGSVVSRKLTAMDSSRILISNEDGLIGDPIIDLAASGVSQGVYTKVSVDVYGRVVAGSSPTTLEEFGITNALSASTGGTLDALLGFSSSLGSSFPTKTTRSPGTRLLLRNTLSSNFVDMAIGCQAGNMWFSLADSAESNVFTWFGGTNQVATLDGIGNLAVNGTISATIKSFLIKHPDKKKKGWKLQHTSLEGPENAVYFRGRLIKSNVIELPEYWKHLVCNKSITVNLTGRNKQLYYIKQIVGLSKVIVGTINEAPIDAIDVDFTVFGERKDVAKLKVEHMP